MSSNPVIRCANVAKAYHLYASREDKIWQALFGIFKRYYHEKWILNDLSFEVKRGECFGIIGRNGAGKTTLLQILCGITRPTRGVFEVNGRIAPILALGAGFDTELSGRENVMIGGAILGLSRRTVLSRLKSIADFADIGEYFDQPVKHYSSGMASRLAFAICAHVDADLLIIDEALSVGDESFQSKCEGFIRDFKKHGTLLIVSHDLNYLEQVCGRVLWIEDGRVRACGAPGDVIPLYARESQPTPTKATKPKRRTAKPS